LLQLECWQTRPALLEPVKRFQRLYTLADYWEWLISQKIEVICDIDKRYPFLLTQISDHPPVLFVKGSLRTWDQIPVAVVGTRRATSYGRFATEKLVAELVSLGSTIISGFMYGIDVQAQQTAVKQAGSTVGVLGFGFNHMYPRSQQKIFDEWLAAGQTFVTEFAPQTLPTKGTFPSRNRIVAGLSRAVVVVEAAAKSGSLITANLALEYGREVMAVPGPIHSLYSQGTIDLINQGARLVTSGLQVFEALGETFQLPTAAPDRTKTALGRLDYIQRDIYISLKNEPQNEDQLQASLNSPMNQVLTALSMMEVAGWLKKTGDVWVVNV